jgi:hypothetical protein
MRWRRGFERGQMREGGDVGPTPDGKAPAGPVSSRQPSLCRRWPPRAPSIGVASSFLPAGHPAPHGCASPIAVGRTPAQASGAGTVKGSVEPHEAGRSHGFLAPPRPKCSTQRVFRGFSAGAGLHLTVWQGFRRSRWRSQS